MPISAKWSKVLASMIKQYGDKKGKQVFYASMKKKGIDYTKEFKRIDLKEIDGEWYSSGYISTSHVDSVGDKVLKETLDGWADNLNSKTDFKANPVSIHHERDDMNLAGMGAKAKVDQLPDGEYGLWVETHHNKTHPNFEDTKYQIDNNFITHYSIEYDTDDDSTTSKHFEDGGWVRHIEPETKLYGYGLASPRTVVNDNAKIDESGYKELINLKEKNEVKKMDKKEEENKAPEEKKDEKTEEKVEEKKEETKKEEQPEEKKDEEKKVDAKELAKEVKEDIKKAIIAELKETKPDNAPLVKEGKKIEEKETKIEIKELKEFKETVIGKEKGSLEEQWKASARLENACKEKGIILHNGPFAMGQAGTPFEVKEGKVEFKQLTTDTDYAGTQTTFFDALENYDQLPTIFNNIYGPTIINQLNDEITTWNILKKDDISSMSSINIRARTAANPTAGYYGYGSTPGFDGKVTRKKYNLNFCTSYVEVKVEDEAMELAKSPGGIGDIYQDEIKWSTLDLMTMKNSKLLTGDTTPSESEPYTFKTTIKTSGSIYGRTVTDAGYTTLAAAGVDNMASAPITIKKMRAIIRACVQKGARKSDLVFIGDHLQVDFMKALIQDMQRLAPTSARVGFTGNPELDSVPLFADKDADTDVLFLIDTAVTRIGVKKAATYVEFAKTDLFRKGIIWMMDNLYCTAPSHNYRLHGLATS